MAGEQASTPSASQASSTSKRPALPEDLGFLEDAITAAKGGERSGRKPRKTGKTN